MGYHDLVVDATSFLGLHYELWLFHTLYLNIASVSFAVSCFCNHIHCFFHGSLLLSNVVLRPFDVPWWLCHLFLQQVPFAISCILMAVHLLFPWVLLVVHGARVICIFHESFLLSHGFLWQYHLFLPSSLSDTVSCPTYTNHSFCASFSAWTLMSNLLKLMFVLWWLPMRGFYCLTWVHKCPPFLLWVQLLPITFFGYLWLLCLFYSVTFSTFDRMSLVITVGCCDCSHRTTAIGGYHQFSE